MSELQQSTLFDFCDPHVFPRSNSIVQAIDNLSIEDNKALRGAIYTRKEVVEFILDLIGYTTNSPLQRKTILEPSFGNGDFLLPIISRLIESWKKHKSYNNDVLHTLGSAIFAVELHKKTYALTKRAVVKKLITAGISTFNAEELAHRWLRQGDFLLEPMQQHFDFVAGNPPYIRQEMIPDPLLAEYKRLYKTIYDRADLYIPFIERSLTLLKDGASLGFICANRWTKNRYGGPLRKFVSQNFHLKYYIDMEESDAFTSCVSAYPATMVITKENSGPTRIAFRPPLNESVLGRIASQMEQQKIPQKSIVKEIPDIVNGSEPWIFESTIQTDLIRRLEKEFPKLEETGCKVGIGVATGADIVFIDSYETLDVESDRKLPLAKTADIQSGEVDWKGLAVINPFNKDGRLVDLKHYPKLQRYLNRHRDVILNRHCARKTPAHWYRTIDKILDSLAETPKLLIPDIKGYAHVVYEPGRLYPHHNLYYVISDIWDLRALQAVLLSKITHIFVSTYSTKLRGGYLRFQAQNLRRIRIPLWKDVPDQLRNELSEAALSRDLSACNKAVIKLYGVSREEQAAFND